MQARRRAVPARITATEDEDDASDSEYEEEDQVKRKQQRKTRMMTQKNRARNQLAGNVIPLQRSKRR